MTATLPTCDHAVTFISHGLVRCCRCHADAAYCPEPHDGATLLTEKGWAVWPAQDRPMDWTAGRIADWFTERRLYRTSQSDGHTFARNNLAKPRPLYGYVWITATLDLDLELAVLLDVRRTTGTRDEFDEDRQRLFIGYGMDTRTVVLDDKAHPFLGPHPSAADDLRWFAEQVDAWRS